MSDLHKSLLEGLQDKAEVAQIDAALKSGDAVAAVAKLAELTEGLVPKGLRAENGEPRKAPLAQVLNSTFVITVPSPPAFVYSYAEPARETEPSFAVLAAANRRQIETSGWLLSSIYAGVIAVGGYFLFADKWIGTPLDFASVFFWAFAIDVGADAAMNAAKTIKAPG